MRFQGHDVTEGVKRSRLNPTETTNKMRPCSRIYYSNVS